MRECGVVMATTVAGLSELPPELVADPAAWYRAGGLERAATYPVASVAEAVGDAVGARGANRTLSERRAQAVVDYLEAVLPGLRRAAKAQWN